MTREEREALVKQVFQRITIDGIDFVDREAKPEYTPLFATIATGQKVGYQEMDSIPPPDTLLLLPSGIRVSGVESWVRKLAEVYRGPGRVILVHESVDIRSITPAFFLPIHGV